MKTLRSVIAGAAVVGLLLLAPARAGAQPVRSDASGAGDTLQVSVVVDFGS